MSGADADQRADLTEPLIVHTRVMPWGFVVALPLALCFAYLGAWIFDGGLEPVRTGGKGEVPATAMAGLLIGFALFLFLIGVGELASYLKPAVEVVLDENGVTTRGVLGERRIAWGDLAEAVIDQGQLTLRGAKLRGARPRELRLNFNRLEVEPVRLLETIRKYRPDLAPRYRPSQAARPSV